MRKYKRTIWNSGDVITDIKMNNIINNISFTSPIAYRLPIVLSKDSLLTISKSFNEVKSLIEQGIICYIMINDNNNYMFFFVTGINISHQTIIIDDDEIFVASGNQLIHEDPKY